MPGLRYSIAAWGMICTALALFTRDPYGQGLYIGAIPFVVLALSGAATLMVFMWTWEKALELDAGVGVGFAALVFYSLGPGPLLAWVLHELGMPIHWW